MNNQKQPDQLLWPYIARNLDVRWLGGPAIDPSQPIIVIGSDHSASQRPYYRLTVAILARLIRAIESLAKRGRINGDATATAEATKGAAVLSPLLDWMAEHSGAPESVWARAWETGGDIPDDGRILWELASIDNAVNAAESSRVALNKWVETGGICTADIDAGNVPSEPKQHRRGRGRRQGKQRTAGATAKASTGLW